MERRINKINKMARKANGPGFTQRSGKSPVFKMMGSSSPVKEVDYAANIAAVGGQRRFDSMKDAMAYRNSPQYNIDRTGEERTWDGKRQWRTAKGDWAGMSTTYGHGGKVTYKAPEFAKLQSALPEDIKGAFVSTVGLIGPNQLRKRRKSLAEQKKLFAKSGGIVGHTYKPDPTANLSADEFWSQYSG